ncbi:MAG: hypothetical protein R3314_00865 [Longimicrobiales bacterium]|nr:hypothetical protein [Longimicrobiales bacterium]
MAGRPGQTDDQERLHAEESDWPYASLLIFGFFGTGTPQGKRLAWRTTALMAVFAVSAVGLSDGFRRPFPDVLWLLGLPGSAVGVGWAYGTYLGSLDELSRAIQLRAFAFAYGAAMALVATSVTIVLAAGLRVAPMSLLALPVLAEACRGLALVYLARQYR